MVETSIFRVRGSRWLATTLGAAFLLLVSGSVAEPARSDCPDAEPADAFSEKIDTLLTTVEGSDFPSAANLESWQQRSEEIEAAFAEILALSSGDVERRRATVHTLLAARSLSASPSESRLLGTGLERGEVRAWARRALRNYAGLGITAQDRMYVDAGLISGFQQAWADPGADHRQRSLPLYQEKAAALRGLARFREAPSCD